MNISVFICFLTTSTITDWRLNCVHFWLLMDTGQLIF